VDSLDELLSDKEFTLDKARWSLKLTNSRYESEQRHRAVTGKLLDDARRTIETQQRELERVSKELDDHRKMLLNTGTGLMFRMRDQETKEKESKDNVSRWLSIASIVVALIVAASRFIHL
jgi:hypothetical protein